MASVLEVSSRRRLVDEETAFKFFDQGIGLDQPWDEKHENPNDSDLQAIRDCLKNPAPQSPRERREREKLSQSFCKRMAARANIISWWHYLLRRADLQKAVEMVDLKSPPKEQTPQDKISLRKFVTWVVQNAQKLYFEFAIEGDTSYFELPSHKYGEFIVTHGLEDTFLKVANSMLPNLETSYYVSAPACPSFHQSSSNKFSLESYATNRPSNCQSLHSLHRASNSCAGPDSTYESMQSWKRGVASRDPWAEYFRSQPTYGSVRKPRPKLPQLADATV